VLAAQGVDVLWALFVLGGIEHLRVDPALPSNPLDLYDMPWTHSLAGALVWSAVGFGLARAAFGSNAVALAVGATVGSHWLLDLLVHRPDLPLWPGSAKVGFGLWNYPVTAFVVEIGLLFATAWWLGRRVPWWRSLYAFVGVLALIQLVLTLGPPAFGPTGVAISALSLFLGATLAAAGIERRAAA
jgi:LexA-binding, inner membrane-associated putative hydrolase